MFILSPSCPGRAQFAGLERRVIGGTDIEREAERAATHAGP
jgi:hypothetical protein